MADASLIGTITQFSWHEWLRMLEPLALYILAMAIYATFIFRFYRFIAARDLFGWTFGKSNTGKKSRFVAILSYILEYLILFPLFVFFWFAVMAIILIFLSKNYTVDKVLLIAMAIVGAIRVTAYYNEDLSRDLAKMVPFTLLGIFLIDGGYFSWSRSVDNLFSMVTDLPTIISYLLFIILLEFILRMLTVLVLTIRDKKKESS